MNYRKLKNGQRVKDAPTSVKMTIDSKCPRKWAFVDMETGDIWVHKTRNPKTKNSQYDFYRADKDAIRALDNIMRLITIAKLGINPEMP